MHEAEFMHVLQTVECLFELETPILCVNAEFYEMVPVATSTHVFDFALCRVQSAKRMDGAVWHPQGHDPRRRVPLRIRSEYAEKWYDIRVPEGTSHDGFLANDLTKCSVNKVYNR
jgi:hypothetical protein